ncbi:MAG: universal stress protein [Acidimicrobiia bacterium]|nr:universal stress protein [Acidimicrobiia bacterium]
MKRIVVGADGSPGSANALRWAAHIATSQEAEIVVMTGFVPTESELPPRRVEALLGEQQQRLEAWSQAARLGTLQVRTVVERGDPRDGILKVAEREQANLIVVGRVGRSAGPGLLHIGSMGEWLAHNSHMPMAIVGGAVNVATRSVLVGVDGSPGSRAALDWVADLAKRVDLRVVAAAVHTPYVEWTQPDPDTWRTDVERQIREEFADSLITANVEFDELALRGSNVADVLLQAAQDERTDVIVVGARGLGGFSGLRIGGVALKTLHRADRPVVIIPTTT